MQCGTTTTNRTAPLARTIATNWLKDNSEVTSASLRNSTNRRRTTVIALSCQALHLGAMTICTRIPGSDRESKVTVKLVAVVLRTSYPLAVPPTTTKLWDLFFRNLNPARTQIRFR